MRHDSISKGGNVKRLFRHLFTICSALLLVLSVAAWLLTAVAISGAITGCRKGPALSVAQISPNPAADETARLFEMTDESAHTVGADGRVAEISAAGNPFGRQAHRPLTNEALSHLRHNPNIRELSLRYSGVTDFGMAHVATLTGLRSLDLYGMPITEAGIAHLTSLPHLKELVLTCSSVSDTSMAHVGMLTTLRELWIAGTDVGDEGLRRLGSLRELEVLDVGNPKITDAGVVTLQGLSRLRYLGLSQSRVGDDGLAGIRTLTGLEELHIGGTRMTNAGLRHLSSLPRLRVLWLYDTSTAAHEAYGHPEMATLV
jgi:hypothetical protein